MHESLHHFHPVIARWFEEKVGIPTPPQILGWPVIGGHRTPPLAPELAPGFDASSLTHPASPQTGNSALILAPTGSGKTLAAFLAAIDSLAKTLIAAEEKGAAIWGVQILYISPLKSLANDIQKNLLKPLAELADTAAAMKVDWPEMTVAVRTGDTPQKDRTAIARRPPHILITTPESLNLMLTTAARSVLATTRFLIVDEVHALAGTKRGVFLSLLLERLEHERAGLSELPSEPRPSGSDPLRRPKAPAPARLKIAPGVYIPLEPLAPLIRVGLSATARPEEHIARWLAGYDDHGSPRPIQVIQTGQRKRLDLSVICPFGAALDEEDDPTAPAKKSAVDRKSNSDEQKIARAEKIKGTGHWPEVTRTVLQLIRDHKSTLVFANSRRLIERLAARFQDELLAEQNRAELESAFDSEEIKNQKSKIKNPVILPHHGSISKEVRLETEQALKNGQVDAVLATSSLELGIDIGALDLVIQIDSPGNVAAGLQRVGRAGHLEKATAKGRFIARGRYELPAFAALIPLMFEGRVEETRTPENCLDVLAQQIVAACAVRPWKRPALYNLIKRATPYHSLSEKQFDSVVAMLSKRAERVTAQGLRPRISFDRVNDELIIMPGSAQVVMLNSGVIADTGQFPVYLANSKKGRVELSNQTSESSQAPHSPQAPGLQSRGFRAQSPTTPSPRESQQAKWGKNENGSPGIRLGELDEEFVYETKEGDRIILGSQTWRVARIDADRVLVEPAAPGSSRMPFWRGESAPRSEMLGDAVAHFHGEMVSRLTSQIKNQNSKIENPVDWLTRDHHFDEQAAENALTFYQHQLDKGAIPTDKQIVVEHFLDRTGEPIIAILCPLGSRVNYALRLALEGQFARRRLPAQLVHNDDGIIIRPPVESGEIPQNPLAWLRSDTFEQQIIDQLEGTALFGMRFRQNAARALMLPRMALTQRTPLWQQRLRARHLLALVKKQRNFPIIIETYREILQDVLNIPRVAKLLQHLESGEVTAKIVHNHAVPEGSPFARSLFSQFMAAYLYEWDDPLTADQLEPAVDQRVLDEILQRRGDRGEASTTSEITKAWEPLDEEALRRRILGTDYPARTAEELLEKIEAAGAAGIALGLPDDERWSDWAVGGLEDSRAMLTDLLTKRRILLVQTSASRNTKKIDATHLRWLATENLSLLLTALKPITSAKPKKKSPKSPQLLPQLFTLNHDKLQPLPLTEIPHALLESPLSPEEARRLIVEQVLRLSPVTTTAAVTAELPWMPEARPLVESLQREGHITAIHSPDNSVGGGVAVDAEPQILWTQYAEELRAMALRRQRRAAITVDLSALQRHLLHWHHITPHSELSTQHSELSSLTTRDSVEDTLDLLTALPFPLDLWEHDILPPRIPTLTATTILNDICRVGCGGHRVWVANADGAIAFWPRHLLTQRPSPEASSELSPTAQRLCDFLQSNGASFQYDMQLALSLDDAEATLALRDLAFAGLISSDQLETLRDTLRLAENTTRDQSRRAPAPRLHATHPRHAQRPSKMSRNWWRTAGATTAGNLGGRWFLLPAPVQPTTALDLAERAADRTDRLLRRTAFACRELLEPIDGPWRDNYDVLTRMEWAGSVRRGYFVDGIAGSQFALPTTNFTQNSEPSTQNSVTWLSTLDPANIWSRANTRWISDSGLSARVPRAPGNWIALINGRPVLAATSWAQRLIPLPAPLDEQTAALQTVHTLLTRLPRATHPYLAIRHWDQQEILSTPAAEILHQQNFTRDPQSLRLYRKY